jgi:hypothetical protein
VRASLSTAQSTGATATFDINKNGTSIMTTTKITIDNGERTSVTALVQSVLTTTSLASDDEMSIDITQIGDLTAKGLKVTFLGTII